MADIADQADIQVSAAIAAALATRKPVGPKAVGHCLYCKCSLPHGMRWCDSGCQTDWSNEQDAIKRNEGGRG